jgi:hypothetical protein
VLVCAGQQLHRLAATHVALLATAHAPLCFRELLFRIIGGTLAPSGTVVALASRRATRLSPPCLKAGALSRVLW